MTLYQVGVEGLEVRSFEGYRFTNFRKRKDGRRFDAFGQEVFCCEADALKALIDVITNLNLKLMGEARRNDEFIEALHKKIKKLEGKS